MSLFKTWFDFLKITLASSTKVKQWGTHFNGNKKILGEITTTEFLFPTDLTPVPNGLFSSKIFGPVDPFRCICGELFRSTPNFSITNPFCFVCGMPKLSVWLRRSRMGYIQLCRPVSHIWYLLGVSSSISLILNIDCKRLERIIYKKDNKLSFFEFDLTRFDFSYYDSLQGAAFLKQLLTAVNLKIELLRCRLMLYLSLLGYSEILSKTKVFKNIFLIRTNLFKRIRLLENFISSQSHPSWMILEIIPVLPPHLRPLFLESTGLIVSPLNYLYLDIIRANEALFTSMQRKETSKRFLSNAYHRLQKSVDCLIDNNYNTVGYSKMHNSNLSSLSNNLRGKLGRFRYNLLGKRVDSSGRSVIAVGPSLKLNQCGLPFKIAIKLFEPFLISQLLRLNIVKNIVEAQKILMKKDNFVKLLLNKYIKRHLILVNRAPTLHRLGLQAFEPILISGDAILFPALLCTSFNADFDGDQMSIYLPFSKNSQRELQRLVYTPHNLISVTTGVPTIVPSHEMIIGTHFLTLNDSYKVIKYYNNFNEVLYAFNHHLLTLHTVIWFKVSNYLKSSNLIKIRNQLVFKYFNLHTYFKTTMGRLLVNKIISNHLYL